MVNLILNVSEDLAKVLVAYANARGIFKPTSETQVLAIESLLDAQASIVKKAMATGAVTFRLSEGDQHAAKVLVDYQNGKVARLAAERRNRTGGSMKYHDKAIEAMLEEERAEKQRPTLDPKRLIPPKAEGEPWSVVNIP